MNNAIKKEGNDPSGGRAVMTEVYRIARDGFRLPGIIAPHIPKTKRLKNENY